MAIVDLLVVTAITEEYDEARAVALAGVDGDPGVSEWERKDEASTMPYDLGRYIRADGASMTVALARSTRMGEASTGPIAAWLLQRLDPRCIAMCGVCAGNPKDVTLGDVIVAEIAYRYQEGKLDVEGFKGDLRPRSLRATWLQAAQELSPRGLPGYGDLDETEKELWILERLLEGNDPIAHPARVRYFPDNQSWQMALGSLATRRLITKRVPPTLTKSGEQYIRNKLYLNPVGPAALPFQIITMPIASGDVVVKGGLTWEDLATQGVRTVTGLEMEAATIANIAYLAEKDWFVAKGVMDYANPRKTDRYKRFAASASAEVLFRFMSKHLCRVPADAKRRSASVRSVYIVGGVTGETNYTSFEQTQLGDVCRQLGEGIARAGAELVVCSPFADSADHYAVLGYVRSGMGRAVHFHRPRHESVDRKQEELLAMLGATSVRFVYWDYPGPHNDEDWGQAWMLSQLMALERSDAVVAIGGRTSKSAWTLLHLADSRRKIIVPFSFLGGASARIFDVKDWGGLYPGFDQNRLTRRESVAEAMEIVNMFASASFVDTRGSVWPPRTIFISRARTDSRHADALAGHLEKAGYRVVMGDEQVRTERMTTSAIEDAVLRSDLFIALWSSEYAMSVFCHDELELALVRRSLGHTNVAIFSLDGTQVVQRSARNLPCLVVESTEVLVSAVMEVLDGPVPRPNDRMTPSAPEFKPID